MFATAAGAATAQAPFTIVRPADGAKVRENVHVLIPKGSIPPGGYVGVFLGGKFIEATVPPLKGKFYDYVLDTKARNIPDGSVKLELQLYVDYKDTARVAERTSVDINVANVASIPVPADGFKLRYAFRPGTELIYDLTQDVSLSSISEHDNGLGGRPSVTPLTETEKLRLMYATDTRYPNGDGLVRMQPLPPKGKDYAWMTLEGDTQPKKYLDIDMQTIYMRLTGTGMEVFSSIPIYQPIEGSSTGGSHDDLVGAFPLPTLPTKSVKPGDSWQSRFQYGIIDLTQMFVQNSTVLKFPAVGKFAGVEWEMGHPCAKLTNTITAGLSTNESKRLADLGRSFTGNKINEDETIWFALDKGIVLKIVRTMDIDEKTTVQTGGGAAGGGSNGANGPGPVGPGGPTGPGGSGGSSGKYIRQAGPAGKGGARQGGAQGRPGGIGQRPGVGGVGNRGSTSQTQFIRLKFQQVFVLEE